MWFRKGLSLLLLLVGVTPAAAQVSPVYSFTAGTVISSAEVNANFAMLSSALNRTGGTITGNIAVDAGITIDGIDLSAWLNQAVLSTSSPTFAALTVTGAGTFGATLGVTGNFAVNTNKFTVAASTGNTLVAGTLDVGAAADFAGAITAGSGNVGIIDSTGKIPAITSTYFAATSPVFAVAAKTTTYTATTADAVLTANGTFTINLYAAAGNAGRILEIKNIGTGVITIDANGAELIDGALTQTLDGQYFSFTLLCDGTGWSIL